MSWYDMQEAEHRCECGWVGPGSQLETRESFDAGAEKECPSCGHYFGFFAYPLLRESMNDPHAPESDRQFAAIVLARIAKKQAQEAIENAAK